MTEFELKLEVPAGQHADLAAALALPAPTRLRARYFDTAEADLHRAGMVIRIRREADRWIQTLKVSDGSALQRTEYNDELDSAAQEAFPAVSLALYQHTPHAKQLRRALRMRAADLFPPLVEVFETDVQRQAREMKVRGSTIEIALDRGRVAAGQRAMDLCELEFELKAGNPEEAVRLARKWCARYGLCLSSISKSAKGWRLSGQALATPATGFTPPQFDKGATGAEVIAGVVQACLDQIIPNASEVAAGSVRSEHIHQLRVGIRRLRTALRELKELQVSRRASQGHRDPWKNWDLQLTKVFRVLGEHRDQALLDALMQPQLEAAGGPRLEQAASEEGASKPGDTVRSLAFQLVLLDLLALVHRPSVKSAVPGKARKPKRHVRGQLQVLHRKLVKAGHAFVFLEPEEQHRVRKRLKRLRYLAEFSRFMFNARKVEQFLGRVKPAQDALGLYTDELVAQEHYRSRAKTDPRALFGVGWLSARREGNAKTCATELQALAKLRPFWE